MRANLEQEYAAKSPLDLIPLIETIEIILPFFDDERFSQHNLVSSHTAKKFIFIVLSISSKSSSSYKKGTLDNIPAELIKVSKLPKDLIVFDIQFFEEFWSKALFIALAMLSISYTIINAN